LINNKANIVNSLKVANKTNKNSTTSTTSTKNINPNSKLINDNSKLINDKDASSTIKQTQIDFDSDDEDDTSFFLPSSKVFVILNILTNDLA